MPSKLLLQLSTAFQKGGLRDRKGTFFYKDHLCKINVPVLALGGDQDLICPPEAVYGKRQICIICLCFTSYIMATNLLISASPFSSYGLNINGAETAKLIPEPLITYKILGEPGGPHYAHYDLVGGRLVWFACIFHFDSLFSSVSTTFVISFLVLFMGLVNNSLLLLSPLSSSNCRLLIKYTHISSNSCVTMTRLKSIVFST